MTTRQAKSFISLHYGQPTQATDDALNVYGLSDLQVIADVLGCRNERSAILAALMR